MPAARIRHLGLPLLRYISRDITVKIRSGGVETTAVPATRRPVAETSYPRKSFAKKEGRARSPASLLLRFFCSETKASGRVRASLNPSRAMPVIFSLGAILRMVAQPVTLFLSEPPVLDDEEHGEAEQ
jgi:hypothetical protein